MLVEKEGLLSRVAIGEAQSEMHLQRDSQEYFYVKFIQDPICNSVLKRIGAL